MSEGKRPRPRVMPSTTTKLATELGNLYVTVTEDEDGRPFEVFGAFGKAGSLQHGMTELACRLVALHLRRGTPLEEIVEQCQGISEMQAWPNDMGNGKVIMVHGLGDSIAHVLREYLKDPEEPEPVMPTLEFTDTTGAESMSLIGLPHVGNRVFAPVNIDGSSVDMPAYARSVASFSCDLCGNTTRPLAMSSSGETLCDACEEPESALAAETAE